MSATDRFVTTDLPHYGRIPEWVLYHPDLNGQDIRVFGVLERFAGKNGAAWPSLGTIGDLAGRVSEDTVRRSIVHLAKVGAVDVLKRWVDGRQTSNRYVLHFRGGISPDETADLHSRGSTDATPGGSTDATAEGESVERESQRVDEANASVVTSKAPPKGARVKRPREVEAEDLTARFYAWWKDEHIAGRRQSERPLGKWTYRNIVKAIEDMLAADMPEASIRAVLKTTPTFTAASLQMAATRLEQPTRATGGPVETREVRVGEMTAAHEAAVDRHLAGLD